VNFAVDGAYIYRVK